jgi:hypothetical protein
MLGGVATGQEKLTTDLAAIPEGAIAVAHVRVADIYASEVMADVRKLIDKAGPEALGVIDSDFYPAPSTLRRVTTIVLPISEKDRNSFPGMVTLLSFSKPVDMARIQKTYMQQATTTKVADTIVFTDKVAGMSACLLDESTLAFGDEEGVPRYLGLKKTSNSAMKAYATSASSVPVSMMIDLKATGFMTEAEQNMPLEFRALAKMETLAVTMTADKTNTIAMKMTFPSDEAAMAGERSLRAALDMGREQLKQMRSPAEELLLGRQNRKPRPLEELPMALGGLAMLGGVNTLDDYLRTMPLERNGGAISTKIDLPSWSNQYFGTMMLAAGVALPAVQKVRTAAATMQSQNNMKQLALAMYNYESAYGNFPPAAICDKNGKPLLSWRVAILPFIEQDNLYRKFKLDEPWDSEHNKPLSEVAIKTFQDPRYDYLGKMNHTHYKIFVGKNTFTTLTKGARITDITDGASNTIMIACGGDSVPWAAPDDFAFDPNGKLPDLTCPGNKLLVAMCDGSVRTLQMDAIKDFEKLMKLLIQKNDGQVIPWDFE